LEKSGIIVKEKNYIDLDKRGNCTTKCYSFYKNSGIFKKEFDCSENINTFGATIVPGSFSGGHLYYK
jgi:hypothetical protein